MLAHNKITSEAVVYHWDETFKADKKFVLGYPYVQVARDKDDKELPLFDEYSVMFAGCDKFNHGLHNKTWPFKYSSDMMAVQDYLFTSLLMNCYNLYRDVGQDPLEFSFKDFCECLAIDIIKSI